ncbi:MAG: hypothetical protein ACRDTM_07005 [Micromonosporaceae bacterium]
MTTPSRARVSDESHPVRRPIRLAPLATVDRRRSTSESPSSNTPWDGPVDEWVDDMDGDWDAVHP